MDSERGPVSVGGLGLVMLRDLCVSERLSGALKGTGLTPNLDH